MKTVQCAHPPHFHKAIVVMGRMGALDCLHDFTIHDICVMLLALCLLNIVCHKPIFILINVFTLLA